jgi:PAS domain S-box-containing protein
MEDDKYKSEEVEAAADEAAARRAVDAEVQRLTDFVEASSDWRWEMDAQCRFTYFSDGFEDICGIPPRLLLGKTRAETAALGEDTAAWQAHLDDLAAHRSFRGFRRPRKRKDGDFVGYRGTGHDVTELSRAEEKAGAADVLLRSVVDSLSELFALWDANDRLVLCNDLFRAVNAGMEASTEPGITFEEHLRAGLDRNVFPGAIGHSEDWLRGRLERHRNPGGSFETTRADGQCLLINERRMPNGGTVTIGIDITEQKRTEAALRQARDKLETQVLARTAELELVNRELAESEERFRDFADTSADYYYEIDENYRYTYFTGPATLTGLDSDRLIGKTRIDFLGDAYDPDNEDEEMRARRERRPYRDIERPSDFDSSRWLRTSGKPRFSPSGEFLGYRGATTEITRLKQQEQALRENEEQLRLIADLLPALITYMDESQEYKWVNRTAEKWLQLPASEIIGRTVAEILGEEASQELRAQFRRAASGQSVTFETEHHYPDGEIRNVSISYVPDIAADGSIRGFIGLVADITGQKRQAERLRQSQKMEAIGQLTGGIAHDFNNLLAVMMGNIVLLQEDLGQNPDAAALIEPTSRAIDQAALLTSRMLAFSRQQPLAEKEVDVNELLESMESLLRRSLAEEIEIVFDLAPDLRKCLIDPGQLEQAILNMAINARDAMSRGGRL